ncbi:MAG: hypothetical protein OET21_19720 [Desulfobacterales bacterium]|nr:hypothetical protein [Desulfobacterales bacterium]
MKYLSTILICIFLFIGGCNSGGGGGGDADEIIPGAGAEDYTAQDYALDFKMWEPNDTPFADADKTETDDLNMCWAAAAANLLAWAGWAADEDDTFDIFRAHFEDKPGYVYDALSYYLANYETGVSVEMVSVREARSHMLLDFIVSAVHEGKGVAMKITYPGKEIGHFLTIYGYRYLAVEDNFILYFTDSDDGLHQMRQFKVEWNDADNRWEIQNLYRDYYLVYALSLARS